MVWSWVYFSIEIFAKLRKSGLIIADQTLFSLTMANDQQCHCQGSCFAPVKQGFWKCSWAMLSLLKIWDCSGQFYPLPILFGCQHHMQNTLLDLKLMKWPQKGILRTDCWVKWPSLWGTIIFLTLLLYGQRQISGTHWGSWKYNKTE